MGSDAVLPLAVQVLRQLPTLAGQVVGDLSVLTANRPPFVAAHAAANLLASYVRAVAIALAALVFPDARSKDGHSRSTIAMLGAFIFAAGFKASRGVFHANSGARHLPMLTAVTTAANGGPFDVAITQNDFSCERLRQYGYGDGGGVDAAFSFSWWDALPAMPASFISERLTRVGADDAAHGNTRAAVNYLDLKAPSAMRASHRRGVARLQDPSRRRRLLPREFRQSYGAF